MFGLFKKKRKNLPSTEKIENITDSVEASTRDVKFLIGNSQHQGQRNYQEDSFGISDTSSEAIEKKGLLSVLADGMGGLANGKDISQKTVSYILNWFNSPQTVCENAETMKNVVKMLNGELSTMYGNNSRINSGTTLVLALVKDGLLHWLCVGDSRLYIKRDNKLYQVNEDHDYLNQLIDEAIDRDADFDKAFSDPQRDSLAACIGKRDLEKFDYSKRGLPLKNGDVLLLCSDGVYNAMSKDELINNITGEATDDAERIKSIILSKKVPHQDNNTVILVTYYNTKG